MKDNHYGVFRHHHRDLVFHRRGPASSNEVNLADAALHVQVNRHRRLNALGIDPDAVALFKTVGLNLANAARRGGGDAGVSGQVDGGFSDAEVDLLRVRVLLVGLCHTKDRVRGTHLDR